MRLRWTPPPLFWLAFRQEQVDAWTAEERLADDQRLAQEQAAEAAAVQAMYAADAERYAQQVSTLGETPW